MSETMAQVPSDSPLMIAWEAYKLTPEYANTRKWALYEAHVDGSLWAAFCAGFTNQTPATPPTPDRAAVREALVRILRESEAHAAINDLTELLGVNDLEADTEDNIADALLRPALLPADVQAAVEQIRSNLDNETAYKHAYGAGTAPLNLEHADGNEAFICSEASLRTLLAHLTREAR